MRIENFAVWFIFCTLLSLLSFVVFSGYASAIPNPASVYCMEMNGTIEINKTSSGEQGLCVMNENKYDEWKFLEGSVGQNYSWCVKNGYGIETVCDGKSPLSSCRAVCVFQNGTKKDKKDMIYLMNLYEKIYGKEIDPDKENKEAVGKAVGKSKSLVKTLRFAQSGEKHAIQSQQDDLPDYFDWRNVNGTNYMSSVKSQVGGTCWAYAVIGTVEAKYNIEQNITSPSFHINLAERNLASNNITCGCDYCGDYDKGGLLTVPYDFIKNVGITTEQCFPDININSYPSCDERCSSWTENLWKIGNFSVFSTKNVTFIKKMLIEKGPLTVGINANWHSNNGILYCTGDFQWFNHGMVLVGYNDTGQYWILKNSWGKGWMYGGYAYIKYGNCLLESNLQKFAYPKNISKGNFSYESISCKNFVTVCKNGMCDSDTIQKAIEKVCSGGTIFVNNSINSSNLSLSYDEQIEIAKNNIVLDCSNATINGNDTKGIGMWIVAKNTTIKNCIIKNFEYGIILDTSSSDTLINNIITSNNKGIGMFFSGANKINNNTIFLNQHGIYVLSNPRPPYTNGFNEILNNEILNNTVGIFSKASNSVINNNVFCENAQLNFNSTNWLSSYGYNNTCDNANNAKEWNDAGIEKGCRYKCSGINCDADNDYYVNSSICGGSDCDDANALINPKMQFDFDNNSVIDIFDAVEALENLSSGGEIYNVESGCSDVNKNGIIDLNDIFALFEKISM